MENFTAELAALDAEEKTADADTPKLLVENNDESRRIKEMVEKAVNREESRQERMREGYKESTKLFLWLFNINQTCSLPQLKIEATTATEVYDTYLKAHNKKTTWELLRCREKGQWGYNCRRIKAFQNDMDAQEERKKEG